MLRQSKRCSQNLLAEIAAHEYDHAAYFRTKAGPQAFPFPQVRAMTGPLPSPTDSCAHAAQMLAEMHALLMHPLPPLCSHPYHRGCSMSDDHTCPGTC